MSATINIRLNPANPDHHLWNNHGTWFIHYTLHRSDYTKQRVRTTLRTSDRHMARQRRDECLALLGASASYNERSPGHRSKRQSTGSWIQVRTAERGL